jgi:flagellin FlaB
MIAFVIVAAALAFVVLNMGFSTTQKAKTTIVSGLGEASSSLEISGKVFGSGHVADAKLNVTAFPIKIASGGESVNLQNTTAAVKYLSNSLTYDDILAGSLTTTTQDIHDGTADGQWLQLSEATETAKAQGYISDNPFESDGASWPSETAAFIYWTVNDNNNEILDQGEHAVLAIVYAKADRPAALDKVRAEILVPTGAALTVERQIPSVTTTVVDLG